MPRAVLIAGAGGMLGTALQQVLADRDVPVVAPSESAFDITDPEAVHRVAGAFARSHPGGLLVNAAAYTDVERAEDDESTAYRVNESGARILAGVARDVGLMFAHVSTDFVFDGAKAGAYVETDPPHPLSVYGASKLAGEAAVAEVYPLALIVRTAWVFGPGGVNFPVKILAAAASRPVMNVVSDECGSPTYTVDLAAGLLDLADAGAAGVHHLAGSGQCTRYELAVEVLCLAGLPNVVEPATSASFPSKVRRPANSVLDCSRAAAHGVVMPDWHDGLARFMAAVETTAS